MSRAPVTTISAVKTHIPRIEQQTVRYKRDLSSRSSALVRTAATRVRWLRREDVVEEEKDCNGNGKMSNNDSVQNTKIPI